ncbi:T9SS type B sorting domain-containing protein [Aequorivita viscosa]|nr:T9SS type B sorting domain-containing protein [Aequorivita viscosa]
MALCDDELQGSTLDDEISTFDLTTQDILVTGGDPTITVAWFLNPADEAAGIPIPNPTTFQNTATPQTVIGRATSEFGCNTLVTLTLTVLPNPNPNTTPDPLELCDDDDDGIVGGWDLTLADTDIIAGEPDVSVTYYELEADAIAGVAGTEITMPYTNTTPFNQIVYARVEKDVPPSSVGCFTIVELELIVVALPDMPLMPPFADPFIGCDESGSGTAIFDLTLQDDGVLGVQDAADFLPITYYESEADANTPANAIPNPSTYISAGGVTIWVRLESRITGCARVTPFELELELFPTIGTGNDLTKCDDLINGSTGDDGLSTFDLTVNTPLITLGDPNVTLFYYATAADQASNTPIANPSAYQNIISPQQRIFVTVYSQNGCRATNSFLIIVEPLPVATSPGTFIACDSNNDGFAQFDLSTQTPIITGGDPNLTVTYHGTLTEAENNGIQLPNLYTNDQIYLDFPITDPADPAYGTGGVWARVTSTANVCNRIISFALEVHTSPVATEPEPFRQCDDAVADGFTIFDLTEAASEILGTLDPNGFDLYYYENLADAQLAGDLALTAPDYSAAIQNEAAYTNTANPQDIYVLVVGNANSSIPPNPNGAEGCYDIVTLTLIVDPIPLDLGPFEMVLCDDELQGSTPTDEISTFDLTTQDILVTGGDLTLSVLWFETPADEAAGIPIPDPTMYQNFATPQTVIGRITSEFGCTNTITLTLTVLPNPNANPNPEPIIICDDDDDGIVSTFDLTDRDVEILNNETDVTIFYYETMQAAIDAVPGTEITSPYTNIVPYNQIVFARVTNQVPPEQLPCYTIVELELVVVALPDAPDATFQDPLFACDEDGDGTAIFDLTIQNDAVYGIQDPADFEPITYYESQADADLGINEINPADAFQSAGQTIWVRLESLGTGCARVSSFEIEVGSFPGTGTANDLVLCDDEENGSTNDDGISTFNLTLNTPVITGGDPTLTVYYYASEADMNNDIRIATPSAYQNVISPQQEIFVSIGGQNSCDASLSFFITVNPNPEPVEPTPLVACDVDNNGFSSFDLESKTAEIQGGDPTLIITYHENLLDARTGGFPLASPYENIVAFNQTLYVRAAYDSPPNGTGCYTIVTLQLIVRESPVVPQDLPDLVACDDSGFAEFDLTQQEDLIYGSQSPADYTLTYHLNQADANTGLNFIVQPEAYTNISNPQTIWVRLDDNATECYAIGSFDLVVNNGLPITDPTPLELCDDLGEENDGMTTFDLTQKNAEITNGVLTQGVTYFLTEQDAQDNTNRIDPDTAYVNVDPNGNPINPQVLYVRVEDSNSACVSFTTLTIKVISNPNPVTPDPIVLCDYNIIVPPGPYDEVELFDLTVRNAQIRNGNNWTLDYYESYGDAVTQTDAIPAAETTAYQNISNPQVIYVRATSNTTGCFEIVELELIVEPLPDDSAVVEPYVYCSTDGTEIGVFDLTTKIGEILGGQPAPPMEVSFYLTALDAENNTNAITNVTGHRNMDAGNNPINPQTIFTGITNTETGCYIGGVQSFELIVQPGAIAVAPAEPFVICDNLMPSDGFAEFNLEDMSDQQVVDLRAGILAGQDPADFSITFHETQEGAETGTGIITFPYVNIINPQRIYVRVTNETNIFEPSCYSVVEMILKVEQLPDVVLDDEYRLCVDENGNPIAQEEGSPSPPVIDTGLDPTLYTFQWDLNGVIIVGQTGPSIIALEGGTYTVTITELASGCESTVTTTVIVSSPPETYGATLVNGAFAGNHIIEVTTTGQGTYEYQLDDGPFQDSNIFENVAPGDHTITIRDIYGCGSVTFDVGVIDYPLYFTPNADGYHDTWNIIGIASGDPTAKIYIFDRFGKLLKQLSPLGEGWDGTFGGNPMPSSDYWFRVEYTENDIRKEFKGHFTLKR